MKGVFILLATLLLTVSSCKDDNGTVDADPKDTVATTSCPDVKIGSYTWTTCNLDVDTLRNGDKIFHAKTMAEWLNACQTQKPAYCYYNFDTNYRFTHGKLYNTYAVYDPKGLAPKGHHIPHEFEWYNLFNAHGLEDSTANKNMKSKTRWTDGKNGNNLFGFNAFPGGHLFVDSFDGLGRSIWWWHSDGSKGSASYFSISGFGYVNSNNHVCNTCGYYVRLVKD
jgi:uncharacterized protein (TIGR02145 family)